MENRREYDCPKECPDRARGCHGRCERYQKRLALAEAIRAERRAECERVMAVYDSARYRAAEHGKRDRAKRGIKS